MNKIGLNRDEHAELNWKFFSLNSIENSRFKKHFLLFNVNSQFHKQIHMF